MARLRRSAKDEQLNPDGALRQRAADEPQDADTEGHMFVNLDPNTSRQIAKNRSADIDREVRERQRQKEARPNRR